MRNYSLHTVAICVLAAIILACAGASAPSKAQAQAKDKAQAKDVYILKGTLAGGVEFQHALHAKDRNVKCETCHHASKPEKALSSPQQACTDCHTKTDTAPMKTKLQAAFHNPLAKAGLCIDCHLAENAKGKKAPVKCAECHQKANV